ncbi:MAG: sigma-70 family RNA polymerase sigma factor [Acidobacteria bacterium]|nr:sigma-70 family RNA polymerase sigma factor [Acidobacteriota bacterium]
MDRLTDPVPFDERELVERARTDPRAFEPLYREYVARIHAFAWRRTGSRQAAEDVTSATFERALRGLPGFTWQGGGFGPWLYRIATNVLNDHHRAEAKRQSRRGQLALVVSAPADLPGPESTFEGDDPVLRRALGRLNSRYQQALSLRFLAGLELSEAAAAMGCSKETMAVVVSRAVQALRRELEKEAVNA